MVLRVLCVLVLLWFCVCSYVSVFLCGGSLNFSCW